MASNKGNILLFSTADWDNPFWTNKQHVARELSRLGYKVLYVDSIGLRQPTIRKSDILRMVNRLFKGLRPPRKINDNLWVWSPIVIPLQKYKTVRNINKWILYLLSSIYCLVLDFKKPVMWTYNPLTTDLFVINDKTKVVYHCVDEVKQQPGMPMMEIESAEKRLLLRADIVFVTSQKLLDSRRLLNNNTYLFTNVADYDHFSKARDESTLVPDDLLELNKPIIGFVGAISEYKVDFNLLKYVALKCPDYTFVLIGKIGEGEPGSDAKQIYDVPNIKFLGPKSYIQLPNYIKGFDLSIIPSALNAYTHAMFPMKFFEYLAAGKQVVSTNIDSLQGYIDYLYLAKDYDDFVQGINIMLKSNPGNISRRLALASKNTYIERTAKMLDIINAHSRIES